MLSGTLDWCSYGKFSLLKLFTHSKLVLMFFYSSLLFLLCRCSSNSLRQNSLCSTSKSNFSHFCYDFVSPLSTNETWNRFAFHSQLILLFFSSFFEWIFLLSFAAHYYIETFVRSHLERLQTHQCVDSDWQKSALYCPYLLFFSSFNACVNICVAILTTSSMSLMWWWLHLVPNFSRATVYMFYSNGRNVKWVESKYLNQKRNSGLFIFTKKISTAFYWWIIIDLQLYERMMSNEHWKCLPSLLQSRKKWDSNIFVGLFVR